MARSLSSVATELTKNSRLLPQLYDNLPGHTKSFGGRINDAKGATEEFLSTGVKNELARISIRLRIERSLVTHDRQTYNSVKVL